MSDRLTVIGTIATHPQLLNPGSQTPFCSFRLASNDRRFDRDKNEWIDGPTNWFTINAFRGLGVHANESFKRGDRIIVHGRLKVRKWETENKCGTSVEVDAEALGHDLRWGVSTFAKEARPGDSAPDAPQPQEQQPEPVLAGAGAESPPF